MQKIVIMKTGVIKTECIQETFVLYQHKNCNENKIKNKIIKERIHHVCVSSIWKYRKSFIVSVVNLFIYLYQFVLIHNILSTYILSCILCLLYLVWKSRNSCTRPCSIILSTLASRRLSKISCNK